MENMNLLDLNNDILNIIGDFVKQDSIERISNEKLKQDILEYVDMKMKIERAKARKTKKSILNKIDTRCFLFGHVLPNFVEINLGMNI